MKWCSHATPAIPVFGSDMWESADLESFIQCIVGIKSSNLIRSHPCAFVLQASCLIEITFSAVMPRSEIHYEILLPLFVVLEKLRAPP